MENASQEIDRNSNDGGQYQGKKKTIEHKCVLQIRYRDEMFSPNSEYWCKEVINMNSNMNYKLIDGCRVSYFY
jgi:hypothetical protein